MRRSDTVKVEHASALVGFTKLSAYRGQKPSLQSHPFGQKTRRRSILPSVSMVHVGRVVCAPGWTFSLRLGRLVFFLGSFALSPHVVSKRELIEECMLSRVDSFRRVHAIESQKVQRALRNVNPEPGGVTTPGRGFNINNIDDLLLPKIVSMTR